MIEMERLIQIVTSELVNDILKAEEELERILNDISIVTEVKLTLIKKQLAELANLNQMALVWSNYAKKPIEIENKDHNNNN